MCEKIKFRKSAWLIKFLFWVKKSVQVSSNCYPLLGRKLNFTKVSVRKTFNQYAHSIPPLKGNKSSLKLVAISLELYFRFFLPQMDISVLLCLTGIQPHTSCNDKLFSNKPLSYRTSHIGTSLSLSAGLPRTNM